MDIFVQKDSCFKAFPFYMEQASRQKVDKGSGALAYAFTRIGLECLRQR